MENGKKVFFCRSHGGEDDHIKIRAKKKYGLQLNVKTIPM
jgi:hypothetical protein